MSASLSRLRSRTILLPHQLRAPFIVLLDRCRRKPEAGSIAEEAVKTVYEHGAGRSAAKFDEERKELARRFRSRYASGNLAQSNVHPHFVGVFDTVASLGARGMVRVALSLALVGGLLVLSMAIAAVSKAAFATSFWMATATLMIGALLIFTYSSVRSTLHVMRDFPKKGDLRWHIAKWQMKNYDQRRPQGIRFARHALAIDETRADFPRVKWGWKGVIDERKEGEPERFIQLWFAGNHSDIGGSYAEEQSRLSDVALNWMVGEATSIPDPLIVDRTKLNTFPSPAGIQHCEVDAMRDAVARWLPGWLNRRWSPSWKEALRTEAAGAPLHSSVQQRFDLAGVWKCGHFARYQPENLRADSRFNQYYG